jgi:hypothetical protein
LEKETAGQQIETAFGSKRANSDVPVSCLTSGKLGHDENNSTCWTIQAAESSGAQLGLRTHTVLSHVEILKREIKEGRDEIMRRRALIAQRRSGAESANYQLADRRAAALGSVQNTIKRTEDLWNNLHNKTAESRMFLCREAASLYGLRQRTRRKQGEVTNSYTIGGLGIVDLREMNGESTPVSFVIPDLPLLRRLIGLKVRVTRRSVPLFPTSLIC